MTYPHTPLPPQLQADVDALAKNPRSFDAMIEFGAATMKDLNALGARMIQTQSELNKGVNTAADCITRIDKAARKLDHSDPFSKGHRKLKEEFDTLAAAAKGLDDSKAEALAIAKDRMQLTQDLRELLGAGKALLEDYRTKHIPNAESDEEEAQLKRRAEDFSARLMVLEGGKSVALVSGQQVKSMLEIVDSMQGKLGHLTETMKSMLLGPLLDREEKEAAQRAIVALEKISQDFRDGTEKPVAIKKPLQFRPK